MPIPKKRSAFTLIELLAVIAILAVLTAILIPTLSKIRAKSTSSACVSNLRQLANGFLLYAADNNNTWPNPRNDEGLQWSGVGIFPYVYPELARAHPRYRNAVLKGTVFVCPASTDEFMEELGFSGSDLKNNIIRGYAINRELPDRGDNIKLPLAVKNPARTALLMDCVNYAVSYPLIDTKLKQGAQRHGGNINILFCDGHVETWPLTSIPTSPVSETGRVFWRAN